MPERSSAAGGPGHMTMFRRLRAFALRLTGAAPQGALAAQNANASLGWYGPPVLVSSNTATVSPARSPGFWDRGMKLTLVCHGCGAEYPDHSRLDAREIDGVHVFLSCPACKRDLASVEIHPAPESKPAGTVGRSEAEADR